MLAHRESFVVGPEVTLCLPAPAQVGQVSAP
ncbi:MAG: hypothetical protein QOF86_3700 [Baekduia sp.]|jgi:hypothetical protein|nr:hypothetical protein [Baekduia sp.]